MSDTSPLPWVVLKGGHIVDPHAWTIAQTFGSGAEANAHLIVTSVNAHAELLAAAKDSIILADKTVIRNDGKSLRTSECQEVYAMNNIEREARMELANRALDEIDRLREELAAARVLLRHAGWLRGEQTNKYAELLEAEKEMLSAIATRDIGSFTWESRASKSLQAAIRKAEEHTP